MSEFSTKFDLQRSPGPYSKGRAGEEGGEVEGEIGKGKGR